MKQVVATVVGNTEVMPGVYLLRLNAPSIATEAKPGQFIMVRCGEDTVLPRPFSIHRCNSGDIELLYRVVGKGTDLLSRYERDNNLEIFGPLGNGFALNPESRNVLLVAGGIGIAPLGFLADKAVEQGYSVRLLLGALTESQLYHRNQLPEAVECIIATEDGTSGIKGMITDLIQNYVNRADQVFACGPLQMYRTMSEISELKNKPVQVSLEIMMGCGRGICYGCTIKTKTGLKKVCKHGPVFDLNDIIWGELNL